MRFLVLTDIDDLRWKRGAHEADAVLSCGDVADEAILEAVGGPEGHIFICHLTSTLRGPNDK